MKTLPAFKSIRTAKDYEDFRKASYLGVKGRVDEIRIPPVRVIAVTGSQPPGSKQYQDAIAVLYGVGYGIAMGLKFGKLPRPVGYFDYKVGALETVWRSAGKRFDITDPRTLRWQAHLMVPAFVSSKLLRLARAGAEASHADLPYDAVTLSTVREGRCVQVLHVGPYAKEQPSIDKLRGYMAENGLVPAGDHHEIYLSDPGRTAATKLKTVIRLSVKKGSKRKRG